MNCTMLIINCALCLYWVSHLHVVAISVNRKYKDEVKDVTVSVSVTVTDDKVKIGARNGNSNGNGIGTGSANGHGHGDDNASGSATVTDTDIAADKTKGHSDLRDLQISHLQDAILKAGSVPICVLFRNTGTAKKIASKVAELWTSAEPLLNYTSWLLAAFSVDTVPNVPLSLPSWLPRLRCYIGLAEPFDYSDRWQRKPLRKWLHVLTRERAGRLADATPARISASHHRHVLIAFPGFQRLHQVELLLRKIEADWRDDVKVFITRPQAANSRSLAQAYGVGAFPSVVILDNSGGEEKQVAVLRHGHVSYHYLNTFLVISNLNITQLTSDNFAAKVLDVSKHHVPIVVCFYLESSEASPRHLVALDETRRSFEQQKAKLRFGFVRVAMETNTILARLASHLPREKFPFTVLFRVKWDQGAVVDIDQTLISGAPTLATVLMTLKEAGLTLRTTRGSPLSYQPWGYTDPTLVSQCYEGPDGDMCASGAHNDTDNDPRPTATVIGARPPSAEESHSTGPVRPNTNRRRRRRPDQSGQIPLLTERTWADVIERTALATSQHPLWSAANRKWQDLETTVTLIIFLISGCGSCERNMPVFQQIQTTFSTTARVSLYIANCTASAELCRRFNVSGFPTLVALRSVDWRWRERCVSHRSTLLARPISVQYHGVLTYSSIIDWFWTVAGNVVTNVKFDKPTAKKEDVYLLGSLVPRRSRYLPRTPRADRRHFYSYECFHLACERLYGHAACYVEYSGEIPARDFDDDDDDEDMVVSKVMLYRSDGLSATVLQLGRNLLSTLADESDSNIHRLHQPHRYRLSADQRCESDHAACTDLIVAYTRDHARLPVSTVTLANFHSSNSVIFAAGLPILIALVHPENVTGNATFLKALTSVAETLYESVVVVTLDVDQYAAWAGQFVPTNYIASFNTIGCVDNCQRCDVNNSRCDAGMCATGYGVSRDDGSCQLCPHQCVACESDTLSCRSGSCQPGYGRNAVDGSCQACPINCLACDTDVSICDSCNVTFNRTDYGQCTACPQNCLTCEDAAAASCDHHGCREGYSVTATSGRQCQRCPDHCLACEVASEQCDYDKCSPGFGVSTSNGQCIACRANCLRCDGEGWRCDRGRCQRGYGLSPQGGDCVVCPLNCLRCELNTSRCDPEACRTGYTADTTNGSCLPCTSSCLTCNVDPPKCDTDKCRSHFGRETDGRCVECSSHCLVCDGDSTRCRPAKCDVGFGVSHVTGRCLDARPVAPSPLQVFPRLCLVNWHDHQHAAFFPPFDSPVDRQAAGRLDSQSVMRFVQRFLRDPSDMLLATELF